MSKSTALTEKVTTGSPYQLSQPQVLKASSALLKHISTQTSATVATEGVKKSLLDDEDDEGGVERESTPIWLILTTKTHLAPNNRLKPSKIQLPYPLHTAATTTICLITTSPQRTYKDLIASPTFPSSLSPRITRIIDLQHLKSKFSTYEAQRQLRDAHDLFLADDRIVTQLPKLLGKTFYKSTVKRPIPISITGVPIRVDGKRDKSAAVPAITSQALSAEVEKALKCTTFSLSPSTTTAIKIGYGAFSAEMVAENVSVVVEGLVQKVAKGWRGVRALHIKAAESMALPIWLAEELWVDEAGVVGDEVVEEQKRIEAEAKGKGRKRKSGGVSGEVEGGKKQKVLKESEDGNLDREIRERKEMLKRLKGEAEMVGEEGGSKKEKKVKKVKSAA